MKLDLTTRQGELPLATLSNRTTTTTTTRHYQTKKPGQILPLPRLFLLLLFLLLTMSTLEPVAAQTKPEIPTFAHVQQKIDGTVTATIEANMHCDYSTCDDSTGACCTHTVSCGCGCVAGWTGARCDIPSPSEWQAQGFHYKFRFQDKISVRKWTADLGDNGYEINVGESFQHNHHNAFFTLNDPGFRIRVVVEVNSMVELSDAICNTYDKNARLERWKILFEAVAAGHGVVVTTNTDRPTSAAVNIGKDGDLNDESDLSQNQSKF